MQFIRDLLRRIEALLSSVSRRHLLLFILGLLIAAAFDIIAGMTACIIPAVFLAVLIGFVCAWRGRPFSLEDVLSVISGGLIISIMTLL